MSAKNALLIMLTPTIQPQAYDEEFDVIVVGSGAGGLTAAITSALSGKENVLVAEKTKSFGGTTAFAGGGLWIPMSPQAVAAGYQDSLELSRRYIRNCLQEDYDHDLVSAFLEAGPKAIKWLEAQNAVRLISCPMPDYHVEIDGEIISRTLLNAPYDGRQLGPMLKKVRYPIQGLCAFGSMQGDLLELSRWTDPFGSWANFQFAMKGLLRYATDLLRYQKGTRQCNGNAFAGRLLGAANRAGVSLWNNASALAPIMDKDRVVGAMIRKDGRDIKVRARKAVVLASGGFSRSVEMSRKHLPNADWSAAPRGNKGEGLQFGVSAGGNLPTPHQNNALWAPISEFKPRKGPVRNYPHFSLDLTKPGSLIVDGEGRRFGNESAPYHVFGRQTHAAGVRKEYMVSDRRALRKYGIGICLPAPYPIVHILRRGYLESAPTIAALGVRLGINPQQLTATVERFNFMARDGKDLDFSRGERAYDRFYGDPAVKPNPCLAPLVTPPFYALPMYPGNGATLYGLQTDKDAQVLKPSGDPVPGLYAVGADQNNLMKGHYPGGGCTLGPALVFGYRAGLHISQQVRTVTEELSGEAPDHEAQGSLGSFKYNSIDQPLRGFC